MTSLVSACRSSSDFRSFMRQVQHNPCHSAYTMKIHRDDSGQVSPALQQCLDEHGFRVKKVATGFGVDSELHCGRVQSVPCTWVTVEPSPDAKLSRARGPFFLLRLVQ